MSVRIEPSTLRLRRRSPRIVHDVGEVVEIQTARATLVVTVFAEDAVTRLHLPALVHLNAKCAPVGRPIRHTFSAEFDEKTMRWSKERLWVECPDYESVDVNYSITVD